MKKKIYRVFVDVKADNQEEALKTVEKMITINGGANGVLRIQEDPFNDEEEGIVYELAREALSDADVFDLFANKLDLSDKELKKLQEKIRAITDR